MIYCNLLYIALFFLFFPISVFATQSQSIIETLVAQAKAAHIADLREWKNLLHMDKNKSEIVSPYFFLTPLPSKNLAQDELEATIRAFYQPISEVKIPQEIKERRLKQILTFKENSIELPTRSLELQDYHAICRFPARLAFLSNYLQFEQLPSVHCREFESMRDYMAPSKVSIVFPTAHINSPASMFGHTFLLLDSNFQSRLLAFAINYQADSNPNEENALSFGLKGIFGFYTGSYSILPYYDKIKEYSNIDFRDMWEYELNFTQAEITRLYNHIWELSDAYSYYYFFDHNCSYNILWLLEVARPSLSLRKEFIYQVNPPETLFALQKAGLITNIIYRPSKRTKLLSYEKAMNSEHISLAKSLSRGIVKARNIVDSSKLSLQEKQIILESAIELSEYYFIKGKLDKDIYTEIAHELASARASLGSSKAPPLFTPANPLEGNQALRITPMVFINTKNASPALDFRIAYHDITDNDRGYLKGAQIEFMRFLAYYDTNSKNAFKLHELNILSIASIAPISKFFKPFSYRLETGFNRNFNDDSLHYFVAFGGGLSYQFGNVLYGYYLLEPTFFINSFSRSDFTLSNAFGVVMQDNYRLKATLEYKLKAYTPSHFSHIFENTLSINLKHNLGLLWRMQILKNDIHIKKAHLISMMGLRLYF